MRGYLSMMSRSGGLKPSAVAGSPSVTRFTHSSCTGMRASGKPRMAVRKILQGKNKRCKIRQALGRQRKVLCHVRGREHLDPEPQTEYSPKVLKISPQPLIRNLKASTEFCS